MGSHTHRPRTPSASTPTNEGLGLSQAVCTRQRIGNAPMRRLPSRGKTSPDTTCANCFPWRSAWHTPPALSPQTHPCLLACGVSCVDAAPPPIRLKVSCRLALRPDVCPWHLPVLQKTIGSLPYPIVGCAQRLPRVRGTR